MATITTYSRPGGGTITLDWSVSDGQHGILKATDAGRTVFSWALEIQGGGGVFFGTVVSGSTGGIHSKAIDIPVANVDFTITTLSVKFDLDTTIAASFPSPITNDQTIIFVDPTNPDSRVVLKSFSYSHP